MVSQVPELPTAPAARLMHSVEHTDRGYHQSPCNTCVRQSIKSPILTTYRAEIRPIQQQRGNVMTRGPVRRSSCVRPASLQWRGHAHRCWQPRRGFLSMFGAKCPSLWGMARQLHEGTVADFGERKAIDNWSVARHSAASVMPTADYLRFITAANLEARVNSDCKPGKYNCNNNSKILEAKEALRTLPKLPCTSKQRDYGAHQRDCRRHRAGCRARE